MDKLNLTPQNAPKRLSKDKQIADAKKLFKVLYGEPISRRMAATQIGYEDLTYMVTQNVHDWLKCGKAHVVKQIRCKRSNRWVQGITTNPELFPKSNQLNLF